MNRERGASENGRSDAELLKAAQLDADAFHVFYERYARRAYSFFERRTRSREASLDLTAETFARVWLSRAKFRDLAGGSAAPWLFAIARRVLIASVERHALETRARERLGLERVPVVAEPESAWIEGLAEALDALPPGHRQAVELRVVPDLSYEQLAAGLGCSETAVRIRVSRGLSALRHAM